MNQMLYRHIIKKFLKSRQFKDDYNNNDYDYNDDYNNHDDIKTIWHLKCNAVVLNFVSW